MTEKKARREVIVTKGIHFKKDLHFEKA